MTLQWAQASNGIVTAEQDGTTWVLRRQAAPDDHPRSGPGWYLHVALEGGLTETCLPMGHDLARAKREAEVSIAYDAANVRAVLGTEVVLLGDED